MKHHLQLILILVLFAQNSFAAKSVWNGKKSDTSWYNENTDEFHINSAAQFKGLADLVSYNQCSFEGKTVYLDCDIDLASHPWTPIGLHNSKPFYGIFDGQNHSITNLYINTDNFEYPDMKDNVGLFGYAVKAIIRNIAVQGLLEVYSGKYIGGIASHASCLENIYSNISIDLKDSFSACDIGSVVGNTKDAKKIYSEGKITCSTGSLWQQCYVGGIGGHCTNMQECSSNIEMTLKKASKWESNCYGGISAYVENISNCIFTGSLTVENLYCNTDQFIVTVGGISGNCGNATNIISAPSAMSYGRGLAVQKSVLFGSAGSVSNSYYLKEWAFSNEPNGIAISESDLRSGNILPGFDTSIWDFSANKYPSLSTLESLKPAPYYTIEYYVDGKLYQTDEYKEGETVVPPADPEKEGYTFGGWGYVPPILHNNWRIEGSFTINSYVITFMIGDDIVSQINLEYGKYIEPPSAYPLKPNFYFSWGDYPQTVPAHDVTIQGIYTPDLYECVDLGLPSGLLWATKNVGAASPEDYGCYFSWGETIIKESYYWGTYNYCNGSEDSLTKYCFSAENGEVDDKLILESNDDAATVNWGEPWRLPTLEEAKELYSNCSWTLGDLNGVRGCYVTGPSGNSIFLPASGFKQYKTTFQQGSESDILTSTLESSEEAHSEFASLYYFDSSSYGVGYEYRCYGFTARPVRNKNHSGINSPSINDTKKTTAIFDMRGNKISAIQKGINIVKYKDGTVRKVVK